MNVRTGLLRNATISVPSRNCKGYPMPNFEYNKDYPFAAFITNLGKYNEGELVGEWVKFPTTPEEMQEVFKRIGI